LSEENLKAALYTTIGVLLIMPFWRDLKSW